MVLRRVAGPCEGGGTGATDPEARRRALVVVEGGGRGPGRAARDRAGEGEALALLDRTMLRFDPDDLRGAA